MRFCTCQSRSRRLLLGLAFAAPVVLALGATPAHAVVVDFDGVVAAPGGTVFPGGTFAGSGVSFTSGSIPDAVAVGDIIDFSSPVDALLVLGNPNAISPPNFAAASDVFGALDDILMSFSIPITSLALTTDDAIEGVGDVVRLLALAPTGLPFQFMVTAIAAGLDNATTPPGNLLSVGGAPFSFALFQVTTEAEGFDDLTFTPVPEPSTVILLGLGAAVIAMSRRRRG